MNATPSEQLGMSLKILCFRGAMHQMGSNARSIQERAVYMRMAMQWFDAGARLQTFLLGKGKNWMDQ